MKLELLDFTELEHYPGGTGIEFYENRIYVVSDKADELLAMGKKWNRPSLIPLFDAAAGTSTGSELESMTVLTVDKKPHLLIIGSGLNDKRNRAFLLNFKNNSSEWVDLSVFYSRIRQAGITDMNIEGIAEVYDYLVLVNRGNPAQPVNHLVITQPDFWKNQHKASLQHMIIDFQQAGNTDRWGVTGLRYSDMHEDLFITISSPGAPDASGNARPGKSYLAIIENLYRKIGREKGKIKVNHLIDLAEADRQFEGYRVESVCIQSQKDHSVKLQLVADDPSGKTFLFKVWLEW